MRPYGCDHIIVRRRFNDIANVFKTFVTTDPFDGKQQMHVVGHNNKFVHRYKRKMQGYIHGTLVCLPAQVGHFHCLHPITIGNNMAKTMHPAMRANGNKIRPVGGIIPTGATCRGAAVFVLVFIGRHRMSGLLGFNVWL
ncbi:MAG TPA: hypothetical protein PK252_04465 [Bacteroidales bacterium]|nr:hypothetical protein [Bacteroidales bacterium]